MSKAKEKIEKRKENRKTPSEKDFKSLNFRPHSGYQHMVLDYYIERVKAMRAERSARLQAIRTRQQAEGYRETVRAA